MLTVIRDDLGQLLAACEWVPTDDLGKPTNPSEGGRWVWVNQLELSTGVRRSIIHQLIDVIAAQFPGAIGAFWHRRDKTHRKIHWYARPKLLRGGMQHATV
jgi:hypothetical protein